MSYLKKLNILDKELGLTQIHKQVNEVNKIVSTVSKKKVLQKAPNKFGFAPDEIENLSKQLQNKKDTSLVAINNLLNNFRQYLSLTYGIWSIPNLKTAELIRDNLNVKTALEIMAGNGYWTKALSEVGIKTVATDSLEWAKTSLTGNKRFINVKNLDAVSAIKKYQDYDLILCSWSPNFGNSDIEVVKTWKTCNQSHLIFIGEKNGATNSSEFWYKNNFVHSKKIAEINRSFESYDFIQEKIFEVKRK